MTTSTSKPGLSFRKLDLHIHTPGSKCFVGECTPQQIVDAALAKGLDAIAITDHNSAQWVDQVKEASQKTNLIVFPGVEITCTGGKNGIHIVALFDPSKTSKHIEAVLNLVGISPDGYGKEDAVSAKGPVEVIETIYDKGGIPVLAHANSSKGVLGDMSGQPRTMVIQNPKLLAAEGTDCLDEAKEKSHTRVVDYLNGKDSTYRRKLAVFQASDNPSIKQSGKHSLEGIGARYSLFKMEKINLEGIRQCVIDPDVRIRYAEEKSKVNYPRIESIRINSGFLENQEVRFHEGLTTILGAKGAGKSLLIEFMRFALNQQPQNKSVAQDHTSKLHSQLGEYGVVDVTFVDDNGRRYNVSRTFREIDDSPYDASLSFDPAQEFPVLFLSQNEIIKIAENEDEQLQFIDQFFDFRTYRLAISAIEKQLDGLDKRMADALRTYAEIESLDKRRKALQNEIQSLDENLKNPVFEGFKQLQMKEQALLQQREYLSSLIVNFQKAIDVILAQAAPPIPPSLYTDPGLLRLNDSIKKARELLEEQLKSLTTSLTAEQEKSKAEYNTWHPQYLAGKKQYEDNVQKVGGDYKALAVRREKVFREFTDVQNKIEQLESKKREVPEISKLRNDLLDELQKHYDQYTSDRQTKCEKFQVDSGGKLRLKILDSKNVDEFRNSLLSLKRGSYLRDEEISAITSTVTPREFVISLLRYDATKESKHLLTLATASKIDIARMKTLADFLIITISYEELLSLQYKAIPRDHPEILYNIGNETYQPLSATSVGQKCTAMLLMALSEGKMPIVIDQPEDSLDIRSIWDDVCTKLRTGKHSRQFIFTTHNSSLAVASDTDCYQVIEGDASHGRVVHVGSMDHEPMSTGVLKYLEGGKETYKLKYRKYRIGES